MKNLNRILHFYNLYSRILFKNISQDTFVLGTYMLDSHKSHASFRRHVSEEGKKSNDLMTHYHLRERTANAILP